MLFEFAPEFAPAGGVAMAALATLGALCAYIVAFGLVKLGTALAEAIFFALKWALRHIPFGKRIFNLAIRPVEQEIIHLFSAAAQALDGYIAHSWHQLAKLVRLLGRELEGIALDFYHLSSFVQGLLTPQALLRYAKALLHPIRTVQEIERKLRRAEAVALARIRHLVLRDVYPRLKVAEGELTHVIEWDIANLRARTHALERKLNAEYRWIRSRPWLVASAAMTAVVALSLRRLGLEWLRCRNVRRVGRGICGLPAGLLLHLLGLATEVYLLRDLCALVGPIERIALDVEPEILAFVNSVEGFVCGGRASAPSAIVASDWRRVNELPSAL